jgi:nitrogen regulatory protein P-II 1
MQLYSELDVKDERTADRWSADPTSRDARARTKKVEATVSAADFDAIHEALQNSGFAISVSDVRTSGACAVRRQFYRGTAYEVLIPKMKLELLIPAERLSEALAVLAAATEEHASADSTVLVYDVGSAMHLAHAAAGRAGHRTAGSL